MDYILNYATIGADPEIRMYRQGDMPTLPAMVRGDNVEADEYGRKIVKVGTFIDANGDPVKLSKSGFDGTPIGIAHDTKDVTNGPQEVALYVRGHFKGPMLVIEDEEYSDEIGQAVQEAFPEMHIYPIPNVTSKLNAKAAEPVTTKKTQ